MLPLALTVLLQARIATVDLATAAQQSPRPRECRGASAGEDGIWSRLRGEGAQHYCELMARGYARLSQTPADALASAELAKQLAGETPAVRVLAGRAELRLGHFARSYELLAAALSADAQALADPKALHDYARAASLAAQPAEAVRAYRELVSRAALLDDARERTIVRIEAAAHVLARGPAGVDEALGYLAQARQQSFGLGAWIQGLRALAWQRSGRNERVSGLPSAAALGSLAARAPGSLGDLPLIPASELEALRALPTAKGESAPSIKPIANSGKPR